jgi:hypothetical protein
MHTTNLMPRHVSQEGTSWIFYRRVTYGLKHLARQLVHPFVGNPMFFLIAHMPVCPYARILTFPLLVLFDVLCSDLEILSSVVGVLPC